MEQFLDGDSDSIEIHHREFIDRFYEVAYILFVVEGFIYMCRENSSATGP